MNLCSICNQEMSERTADADPKSLVLDYRDYICSQDDHMFARRIRKDKTIRLKVRLTELSGDKLFISIDYYANTTSFWRVANTYSPVVIDQAISFDYSNLARLKQKVRTYLIFS
jgi:hypothetical protein